MAFSHKHNYLYYTMGVIMGVLHSMKGYSTFLHLLCLASSSFCAVLCCASYANDERVEAKCNANGRWQVASGKWQREPLDLCEGRTN